MTTKRIRPFTPRFSKASILFPTFSDSSSLPEVGGDAVLYFNPLDPDDIAKSIHRITGDQALRKMLIEKGRLQAGKFSWRKPAEEMLRIFKMIL